MIFECEELAFLGQDLDVLWLNFDACCKFEDYVLHFLLLAKPDSIELVVDQPV